MTLTTITATSTDSARAWYIKYPLDAYAMGPLRYHEFVTADVASDQALEQFGERPNQIWPDGRTQEVPEYEYLIDVPEEEVEGI
jgi:hypothetical protein